MREGGWTSAGAVLGSQPISGEGGNDWQRIILALAAANQRSKFLGVQAYLQARLSGDLPLGSMAHLKMLDVDKGQGLIIPRHVSSLPAGLSKKSDGEISIDTSTAQQDKNAKIIILPGFDFGGRAAAHRLFFDLEPLFSESGAQREEVIVHHYATYGSSMKETAKVRMDSVIAALDDKAEVVEEARDFVVKYILPRLFDDEKRAVADPAQSPHFPLTLLGYSYGGVFAEAVEKALYEIVCLKPEEYGLPRYSDENIKRLFNRINVVAIGRALSTYKDAERFRFPVLTIHALNDFTTFFPSDEMWRFVFNHLDMRSDCAAGVDPNYSGRENLLLRRVPANATRLNIAGHESSCYVAALSALPAEILQSIKDRIAGKELGREDALRRSATQLTGELPDDKQRRGMAVKLSGIFAHQLSEEDRLWKDQGGGTSPVLIMAMQSLSSAAGLANAPSR